MPTFNPKSDIPNLSDRVCIITGANSGLGEATVAALAQHNPGTLYLAARSRTRAESALERIRGTSTSARSANIVILELDLASIDSVKAAAQRINNEVSRVDIVYLNGGVAAMPAAKTKDGYEVHFGTNYLGHALLTQLLMPKLLETAALPGADVRVISVSSTMHKSFAPREGIVFDALQTPMGEMGGAARYAQAMLAKNLFAREFARRYPKIKSLAVHPGGVKSSAYDGAKDMNWLGHKLLLIAISLTGVSPEEGAKGQLWCSFSNGITNGAYYEPIGKTGKESSLSRDDELASKLWDWTNGELLKHGASTWPPA
ncbi:hypothetical protein EDB81DRAFT_666724 [Dactylonectria macrodidyma]|uniref:Short-chain dehydrogenase/reductase n=1 Tax=Dactylonectria macrodidyma TaxID=307937 RepID=A0A9P9DJJ0_9HYPO|nr:hypothetical protein EDB81DRAFT_666724 [Dactylonectria macrodidyma]